jgi:hypothetical protein
LNDLFCLSFFLTVASVGNWQRRSKIPIVSGASHGVKNAFAGLLPPDNRQTNRHEDREIYIPIRDGLPRWKTHTPARGNHLIPDDFPDADTALFVNDPASGGFIKVELKINSVKSF